MKDTMSDSTIIKTTGLYHKYGRDAMTLFNINLEVKRGQIYGFLGPNGSGKTTTLSLLIGLLKKQQGSIEIFGHELLSNRCDILKRIGSLIETPSLYSHLTAKENLEVYRPLYGVGKERVTDVLQIVGLEFARNQIVKKFSLGMKQRLSLALALLPSPELLVLDEPTNGLDPNGIIELRELIKKLNKEQGMTMIISSHILAEVEKMVTHVGIIAKGKMLFQGTLQELHNLQQNESKLLINTSNNQAARHLLQHLKPEQGEDRLMIPIQGPEQVAGVNRLLIANQLDVFLLQPIKKDLEQLFIDLTTDHA